MYSSAIFVPGFSESARFSEAFAKELCEGPFALVSDVDVVLLDDALARPEKYQKAYKERLVVTHSAGILAVDCAAEIIALNAPEPTKLRKTLSGATQIALDKNVGAEEGIEIGGMLEPALELLRHPVVNAKVPFIVRKFSATHKLINLKANFPGGRSLFATDQDQFGYNRMNVTEYANQNGIFSRILIGKHNHALFQPGNMMQQIAQARSQQ